MLEVSDAGCQRSSIRAPGPKRIRRGKPLTVPPSTPRFTVPPSTPRFNVEQGFALSETGSIKPFVLSTFGGYGMPPTLNLGVRGARLGHSIREIVLARVSFSDLLKFSNLRLLDCLIFVRCCVKTTTMIFVRKQKILKFVFA